MTSKAERWKQAEQRRHARQKLSDARAALRAARAARAARLREMRSELRAAKVAARDRARELRAALIERHREERSKLRADLAEYRARLRRASLEERAELERQIADARRRLDSAIADLAWVRKSIRVRGHRGLTASEAREHERTTTRAELEHEWERRLFDALYNAGRIRSSARRSLGEAFAEWQHDHPGDVWTYREQDAARRLEELEREHDEARRALRRRRRPDAALRASSQAVSDEWGA